jgi:hypothetical protein
MRQDEVTPARIRLQLPGWAQVYIADLERRLAQAEELAERLRLDRIVAVEARVADLEQRVSRGGRKA